MEVEGAAESAAAQESFAIVDLLLSAGVVAYQRGLARAVGDHSAGLLLSQFWYWAERQPEERDGWFFMTQEQIHEETVMTRREQETARRKLRDMGLLEEKKEGLPAKLWYRVNRQAVVSLLREHALQSRNHRSEARTTKDGGKRQPRMAESATQACPKAPDLPGGKRHAITKSSSEITSKNTFSSTLNVETDTTKLWKKENLPRDSDSDSDRKISSGPESEDPERTRNVPGADVYDKLVLDAVAQIEAVTEDRSSHARYVQLREICIGNNCGDAWAAALRSTQKRQRREDLTLLDRPGAWFDRALIRELDKRGIAVPTKAEKAEAPGIRDLIGASLGAAGNPLTGAEAR